MASIDSYISSLGVDLETLVSYTPEELEDLVLKRMTTLGPADQATFQQDLRDELDAVKDQLKELQTQSKKDKNQAEREDDYAMLADIDRSLEDLDAIDTVRVELSGAIDGAAQHAAFLNVTTDQNYNFTYDTSDLNGVESGETVTITGTGTSAAGGSLFADAAGDTTGKYDSDGDGVADKKIDADGDGVADIDVNADGFIDAKDMQAANPLVRDALSGQQLFIDFNPGDTITLVSSSLSPVTAVYKITTAPKTLPDGTVEPGKEFFLNTVGDMNLIFSGTDYIDLQEIETTWPPELAYRCWDGNDPLSFGQHVMEPELSEKDKLKATGGYQEVRNELGSVVKTVNSYLADADEHSSSVVAKLSDEDKKILAQMLDDLYMTRTSDGTQTSDEVWQEFYAKIAGRSPQEKSSLVSALVLAVVQHDSANAAMLLGSQLTQIDSILRWSDFDSSDDTNLNSFDKFMLLLIDEELGAATGAGGTLASSVMSTDGKTESEWKNHEENVEALKWYKKMKESSGAVVSTQIQQTLQYEQMFIEAAEEADQKEDEANAKGYSTVVSITSSQKEKIKDAIDKTDAASITDGIAEDNYYNSIVALVGLIQDGMSMEDLASQVLSKIKGMTAEWQDDAAAGFLYYLNKVMPEMVTSLVAVDGFADSMSKIIWNGGGTPYRDEAVDKILQSAGQKTGQGSGESYEPNDQGIVDDVGEAIEDVAGWVAKGLSKIF